MATLPVDNQGGRAARPGCAIHGPGFPSGSAFAATTRRGALLLLPLFVTFAADTKDPWEKVRHLKTGTEVRVLKAGAPTPIMAQFADLTEDNLVLVVKNEQLAIPRNQVTRIDSRPQKGYVTTETRTSSATGGSAHNNPNPPNSAPTNTSYSTGVAIREKSDFETIYRRAPAAGRAKK